MSAHLTRRSIPLLSTLAASLLVLGGCSSDMSDLENWVADKKAERIPFRDDLPEVKPPNNFAYSAGGMRSPFRPAAEVAKAKKGYTGPKPKQNRNKEQLEDKSLDTLRMVGTLNRNNSVSALVQDPEGLIHQVQVGNYMGQNEGRIVGITDSQIQLTELIPDGTGGFLERDAAIGISD